MSVVLTSARAYPRLGYTLFETRQSDANVSFGTPSVTAADPFDHTWIESFTALGDSYSVGLGAGHAISAAKGLELNTDCSQYSYGYPNLLNADGMIGINPNRNFQYYGCSGALVNDVKSKQVPKMQQSQLVTLSAGGNDAHLATILNYCIYQWATGWFWTCDGEITSANNTINSAQYTQDMKDLMAAIAPKLDGSNARIYWVGYERFWDDTTNTCDDVTWSFTRTVGFRQYLTQARRTRMNSLVDNVNAKIQAVCNATSRCVFVDSSADINALQGHMCEPGVDESYHWIGGGAAANREQTWFYEWGTTKDDDTDDDKAINQPEKRADPTIVTSSTTIANLSSAAGVSFEYAVAFYIQQGRLNNTLNETAMGTFPIEWNFTEKGSSLPDSYGRVFHLDKYANGDVALRILDAMDAEQASQMGQPAITTTLSICTATATPQALSTSSPAASPTVSACVGNQIQGSCTQASLPTETPDGGPLPIVCNKVDAKSTDYLRFNQTQAAQAAANYCANLITAKTVLDSANIAPGSGHVSAAAENGGQIALLISFDVDSCDKGTAAAAQKVDFVAMGQNQCYQNLYGVLAESCGQNRQWEGYNPEYTLEGGVYAASCGLWSMSGLPAA